MAGSQRRPQASLQAGHDATEAIRQLHYRPCLQVLGLLPKPVMTVPLFTVRKFPVFLMHCNAYAENITEERMSCPTWQWMGRAGMGSEIAR